MAQGGSTPNQDKKDKKDKHKSEIFEYEDFGGPSLYLWAIGAVILGLIVISVAAVALVGVAAAVAGGLNG